MNSLYNLLVEPEPDRTMIIAGAVILAGVATAIIDYARSRKEMPLVTQELNVRRDEALLNARLLSVLSHTEEIPDYAQSLANLHEASNKLVQNHLKPKIEASYFYRREVARALREYELASTELERTLKKTLPSWRGLSKFGS